MQHCQGDEVHLLRLGYFVAASTHYSASVCVPTQERGNEKFAKFGVVIRRVVGYLSLWESYLNTLE